MTPLDNDPVVLSGVTARAFELARQRHATRDRPDLVRRPEQVECRAGPERPVGLAPDLGEDVHPPSSTSATTKVSAVTQTDSSLSFHVSRVGTPVLVKVSYFPNWHASGADGPWRVTPNLMVVVPTSHDVTLTYGATAANDLGLAATLVGVGALVGLFVVPWFRQRRRQVKA